MYTLLLMGDEFAVHLSSLTKVYLGLKNTIWKSYRYVHLVTVALSSSFLHQFLPSDWKWKYFLSTFPFFFIFPQDGVRTFDDFLRDGLIEYLDVNEENNALVYSTELSDVLWFQYVIWSIKVYWVHTFSDCFIWRRSYTWNNPYRDRALYHFRCCSWTNSLSSS